MLWRYSLSGLPQMFLLLMLHLNVYALLRAMRAHYQNEPFLGWIAAVGFGFGIMALTHALSIFIFVPVLVFSLFFFRPHGWTALLMMAAFLVVYTPWLVRNQMVCGDFRGIAAVSALDGIVLPEAGHMRRLAIDLSSASGNYFAANFRQNLIGQINRLIEYFGWSFIAPLALVSVLHAFRRPITSTFRWVSLRAPLHLLRPRLCARTMGSPHRARLHPPAMAPPRARPHFDAAADARGDLPRLGSPRHWPAYEPG
jgi:hypothetical protein